MPSRRAALGFLAASVALPQHVFAQPLSYDLRPVPVLPGIWMIEGATEYFSMQNGGAIVNCALLQGETGLILIDSGSSRRYGEALNTAIRKLDLRGVSAVVNTHHHPDHFFGNQVFADKPILALGQTGALARAEGDSFSDNMYRLLGDWMRGTEPVAPNTVLDPGEVMIDGRSFTALGLSGHTAADLALIDAETGLLITGDLAFLDRAPTTPHADLAQWQTSLDALVAIGAPAILPGHGPLDRTGASLTQTRDYLIWLNETLTKAAQNGQSMVEIMDVALPAEFAGMGAQPQEFYRSVSHLYSGIERAVLPRAN
ncbi:quinoprotein relay system zinc metallohydrolase 1 [Marimonas arenosa]|uniref:Quinoprotein relay system zinc metallohydrolase 1 n=1 Tax=Marimonas arenosa TaxID=1795305 RepID=A0AAE4B3Z9_9RHOB|nr:quinoprotein relay system zinc metallohydrolase 1 [Marimonas arenosa]MDQ2089722.1 quinoprotein relay system zinc metallohydrolase 1 [Marimonas arenosa]